MKNILPEQRDFFSQIAELAFVNPFSKERERADCRVLRIPPGSMDLFQRVEQIQLVLEAQLQQLGPLADFRIDDFQRRDRNSIEYAWLFYQFHRFQQAFNQFIDAQRQFGDEPLELPFAVELVDCFRRAGYQDEELIKYIGLFYQLHRGFYFINSSLSGDCPSIIELRMRLWNNIFTFNPRWYLDYLLGRMEEFSTLLLGSTGSGKSLVAHAIGCSGFIPFDLTRRRFRESFTRSFQAINLAQFPASLLESELFGHKKGAFTGAIENHQGLFARCSANGAVFIDEIGDIDIPTQVKLLNVIQDRVFSPVGSHEKLRFSGRVISATNRDIEKLRKNGQFRDDLYYRLCSDVIVVPGLKQRLRENSAELSQLIAGLLWRVIANPNGDLVARIERKIHETVPRDYPWPGNVRELEQCIRRICLTGSYQVAERHKPEDRQILFALRESGAEISAQQLLKDYPEYFMIEAGKFVDI
ncbi:sigma-54-dependent transcriptional regulator [Methylomarinum vadi]|uniref:sigma-54-dependent transcriptional regulator n=1 Tax=Methylomarinum vadi TaxID=438855 RepID=UPI00068BD3F6|nr:sigma 54-interacting transcriptional regulator [Methylomarinum vadi]